MDNMDMNKSDSDNMKENKKGNIQICRILNLLETKKGCSHFTSAACKVLYGLDCG